MKLEYQKMHLVNNKIRGGEMETNENTTSHKLLTTLIKLKRTNWHPNQVAGLTHSEIMVLFAIDKNVKPGEYGIKVSHISHLLMVAPPTITQLINNLETNGFVQRNSDKADRRAVRIVLTEKGKETIKEAAQLFYASINGLVDYLGEDNSKQLIELLSKVINYINEIKE